MSRKILSLAVAGISACAIASPALAKESKHQRKSLNMVTHFTRTPMSKHQKHASTTSLNDLAKLGNSGFTCHTTVGVGANGNTPVNTTTVDSEEFYVDYRHNGVHYRSVITNCVGVLPAGSTKPTAPTSHQIDCKQFDPLNGSNPLIFGVGVETSYPDGMYSETCNTPDYRVNQQQL
jgi:hypothetical protein